MELPEKPGIGVEVIEDRLSKYLRKKLEFRRE
jgi:L-alanine-DL-glutamate epimerase-like enolase superfamily enzyme